MRKALVAVLAGVVGGAWACDLPVAQYALQNWQRNPYQVYYFYRSKPSPKDAAINQYLDKVAGGEIGSANLVFARVDVTKLGDKATPELYKIAWKRAGIKKLPAHIILTPRGTVLFRGHLDRTTLQLFLDSPKRQKIAELLCDGADGVLVLLQSGRQKDDAAAVEVVKKVMGEAAKEGLNVGFVQVARDDAREKGFVAQLLQVEDDLGQIPDPMVFGIFGRGHVLEPCVGRGITHDSVAELVMFMNGPCTCDLKMWNPGMDLLTSFDWDERVFGDDNALAPRIEGRARFAEGQLQGCVLASANGAPARQPWNGNAARS